MFGKCSSSCHHHYSAFNGCSSPNPIRYLFFPSLEHSVFSSSVNTSHVSSYDWILDSGATDHMVHSIHFFTSVTSPVHISVRLPNGDMVKVTHVGTVKISATLTLENVLCIPTFSFNLISISKLTQNPSCCCIFLSHYCFLQDLLLWKLIGLGKRHGRLYTLQCTDSITLPSSVSEVLSRLPSFLCNKSVNVCNLDSSPVVDTSNDAVRLWHYRLGHPSSQRLALLKSIVPDLTSYNNNNSFDCHICPLAKQHKLHFPKSTSVFLACFDLIHADIWGPYSTPSLNGSKYFLTLVDDHSGCTWVYLIKSKSDASSLIQFFFFSNDS